MKQIKIFADMRDCDANDGKHVNDTINNWIKENNINVLDIKVNTNIWPVDTEYGWHPEHSCTITVIYDLEEK